MLEAFEKKSEDLGRTMEKDMLISALWEFDNPNNSAHKLEQKLLGIVNNPKRDYETQDDFKSVLDDLGDVKKWLIGEKLNRQPHMSLVDYCIGWAKASFDKASAPKVGI